MCDSSDIGDIGRRGPRYTARVIEFLNVWKAFGNHQVLRGLNLSVRRGEVLFIIGASGVGKSVTIKHVIGLLRLDRGEVWFDGQRVDHLSEPAFYAVRRRCAMVFQHSTLFDSLSVVDNVEIAIAKAKPRVKRSERLQEARHHLQALGLESAIGKYPGELSGGMRQRAAIARALALGSPLLLMDEPFGALDPVNRARLQDLLLQAWDLAAPRKTIVFVTHDVDEAIYLGDRLVVLGSSPGRVIADLQVPFERPRERRCLLASTALHALREQVAETLAEDTLQRLKAA